MSYTLKTLRNRVQDRTNRPIGGSDDDIDELVNQAIVSVVRDIKTMYRVATVTLVPGQNDYSLATDFALNVVSLKYVEYGRNGLSMPIMQVSQDAIIRYRGVAAGTGAAYYYSLVGFDYLSIYPAPAVGDVMKLWYWGLPDPLVDDADVIDISAIPEGWQEMVIHKACAGSILHLRRGKPQGRISTTYMAEQFEQAYQADLARFRRERNLARGSRGRVVDYGPPRWPRYSNDTDVRGRDYH